MTLGDTSTYDDNLFRLPDGASAQSTLGAPQKSDWIHAPYLGLHLDKPFAQQRVALDARLSRYIHQQFDYLDYDALDLTGSWRWHFTPRVQGLLRADRRQMLVDYAEDRNYAQRNVITSDRYRFTFDWQVFGGWHPLVSVEETGLKNSTPFSVQASNRLDTGEAGLEYVFRSQTAITAVGQQSYGRKLDQALDPAQVLDNQFRQHGGELRFEIPDRPGYAFSAMELRLGYLQRQWQHYAQRDYAGLTAKLSCTWNPSARTQLVLTGGRELGAYETAYSSDFTRLYAGLEPKWQITDNTGLQAGLGWSLLHYHGAVSDAPGADRQDIVRSYKVSMQWSPLRPLLLTGALQANQRGSNYAPESYQYDDLAASLDLRVVF